MEDTLTINQSVRNTLDEWEREIHQNVYIVDPDFMHTIQYHFQTDHARVHSELEKFGKIVGEQLEPLVKENNLAVNLPCLEAYNPVGQRVDEVVHHPDYAAAGNLIYQTRLLEKMARPGGLSECLSLLFLSSQTGEAGHNCPIACSAGIIRVLQKSPDFPEKAAYLEKLTAASFDTNFTGAQFLTEIQGGSDVGINAATATHERDQVWRIKGEKWFCSNAGADLIFTTARYDSNIEGTKGLALFLVPRLWRGQKNHYTIRRLKDKIGTRSMATGEIDFHSAYALMIGRPEEGFHLIMDNVLHLSRLFNSFCVLGMARRAYSIARSYARQRVAFSHPIIHYPLVIENLARIKAESAAMVAAIFATAKMQDQWDSSIAQDQDVKLLLRLLVNMQKYLSALLSVEHIHHSLDVLAGNGTIESFSPIPRLLRDCVVCENWEGTHNVLRMQILKDILKYDIDRIYMSFMRKELEKLKKFSLHMQPIKIELDRLEMDLASYRQLESGLQQLQIRSIVDRMALLFCGLMLLHEAMAQQKAGSSSKLDCYQYFTILHLEKQDIVQDNDYLELITRIIAA